MKIIKKTLTAIVLFGCLTNGTFAVTNETGSVTTSINLQQGEALYNSGVNNYNSHQYESAVSDLLKSIELGYKGNNVYSLIAYSYDSLYDDDNYLKYLMLSENEPNNVDGTNSIKLAELLIKKEMYGSALMVLNNLVEKGKKTADVYNNRGQCNEWMDDTNGAIADYTKSINALPEGNIAWYNRAELYYENQQYSKAVYDLNNYLKDESDIDGFFLRGKCKQALGNYKGAFADYNHANFYNADFFYRTAYCKYKLGDKYGAIADLVYLKGQDDLTKDDVDTYVKAVKFLNKITGN